MVSYRPAASPANQDIGNCLLADIKPDQLRDVGDVAKVTECQHEGVNNFSQHSHLLVVTGVFC